MSGQVLFNDGASYERYMGVWSRAAGEEFLGWLAPGKGLRWLDVGCGNGAFTELVFERAAPASVKGVDPSAPMLNFAKTRFAGRPAGFVQGDAMSLPFPERSFDAAVMPLVLFFVPRPAKGVAEMVRVAAPGATIAAYAWDMPGGGFPYALVREELSKMGVSLSTEPNPEASRLETMRRLWTDAGLSDVETREIPVERAFDGFEDWWATVQGGPAFSPVFKAMKPSDLDALKSALRSRLNAGDGRLVCKARANAVKGRVR